MDVISHVIDVIGRGEAVKANGPIEHWLTTLATGFWGFDDSKKSRKLCSGLQKGDVLLFQAGHPNTDFVEITGHLPEVNGVIGAGIVDRVSQKSEPRWLSEVIESQVHKSLLPRLWPNLVHFSDVVWFGDVNAIPANHVQSLIEGCTTHRLNLTAHIERLGWNNLTFGAMRGAGFILPGVGTGNRIQKNSSLLADMFGNQALISVCRAYPEGVVTASSGTRPSEPSGVSDFTLLGGSVPSKRPLSSKKVSSSKVSARKRNYVQEAANNQQLGLLGEQIVLAAERHRVLEELGEEYASRVSHVSVEQGDGLGYDILSFRKSPAGGALEQYLEVKTTMGDASTTFFISDSELGFAKDHMGQFEIVRVYSLDLLKRQYLEYRLTAGELLVAHMTPVSYRVHVGVETDTHLGEA